MDEDQILQSIIADPDVVDPTIDVSQLRQTTPTSSRLLGDVSGIEGLRYDPTRTDYIRDLYSVYSGGLPTIDVAQDTAQIPGAIDTLVDAGSTDQVTGGGGTTPTETITPDPVVAPGEIPVTQEEIDAFNEIPVTQPSFDDQFQSIEDIGTPIDIGFGEGQVDPGLAAGLEGPIIDTSPVTPTITAPSGDVFAVDDPLAEEKIDFTPETQGLVDQAFSKVGSTASDIMNDLSQIPGAIADFANQTVDIAGQKINVGATLLKAGINKIVGGPISLVFDALQAIAPQDSLANTTTRSIVDELKASGKDYGFNMQSGNLNQDPFGRNPVSGFGDYEQTLLDDIAGVNQTGFQTAEMREKKKEFAQDYFNAKAEKAGGVEVDDSTVLGPGEAPGDLGDFTTGDVNIVDEVALTRDGGQDTGSVSTVGQAGPPSQQGGGADMGSVSTVGQAGPPSQRGGGADSNPSTGRGRTDAQSQYGGTSYGGPPSQSGGGGGGGGGGGKIVCTMMNESYGFGSFRNKIWLRHSKDLAPEYQKGYHKIFLPLVKLSKNNKVLKIMLEHIAVHRTIDIRQESRGKVHLLGRVYRKILEPICYWVGKYAK